jgi:indolepyruvate ferredoxin oxidoreductase alpha subunit
MTTTRPSTNRQLLTGNAAVARGAREAGIRAAFSYPGTPATEILQSLLGIDGIVAEWSVNEKIALECALGVSLCGGRALVSMKQVGLNVAADPLFSVAYTGCTGGLVIVVVDDPGMHSSQNCQDSRHYARAARLPMLEPSDSHEAYQFVKKAFDLSERFASPVLVRLTTGVSHARSVVAPGEIPEAAAPVGFGRDRQRFVLIPPFVENRPREIDDRLQAIASDAEAGAFSRMENGTTDEGIITTGIAYQYCKEAAPGASILKLGMVYPLPQFLVREFCSRVKRVRVIEEQDPFLATEIRAMGIAVEGGDALTSNGELSVDAVAAILHGAPAPSSHRATHSDRLPTLCPGCPYLGFFSVVKRMDVVVAGDIGCYTLSVFPPFEVTDTTLCMGAGLSMAQGMGIADPAQRTLAIIGDSTFCHAGIPTLLNAVYNKRDLRMVILDNAAVAMTGLQPSPSSGIGADGKPAPRLDFAGLSRSLGVPTSQVARIDGRNLAELERAISAMLARPGVSVLIVEQPCAIVASRRAPRPAQRVDPSRCTGCRACLALGCAALVEREGTVEIRAGRCAGCGVCAQLCPAAAIVEGAA